MKEDEGRNARKTSEYNFCEDLLKQEQEIITVKISSGKIHHLTWAELET